MKSCELTTCSLLRRLSVAVAAFVMTMNGAQAATYPATILADNPSAYYRFEETSGITAIDSSSNQINATYYASSTGSPLLGEPGIDTNSILFNGGGSDYGFVDIPSSSFIEPVGLGGTNSGPFSAELWIQPTSQNSSYEVPLEVAQYPNGWNVYVTGADAGASSYFIVDMRPSLFATVGGPVQFLNWYHLVLTFDGTNATIYLNDVAYGPYNATGFVPAFGSDADVGSGQGIGWLPFIGGIDEVAFYTNVLTAAQVAAHYTVGTNSFRAGNLPPSIVTDISSVTTNSGLPATFAISATGSTPLHYTWYSNSIPVGPNASSFTFTAEYPGNNNASIQVVVTNNFGAVTSSVATLTVLTNINIVSYPGSILRNVGSYAAFHVTADGAIPITYMWSVSSNSGSSFSPISGATGDTLWVTNAQLAQSGNIYSVTLSNPFVNVSASATLSVQPRSDPPVPLNGYGAIVAADKPVAYWRLDEASGSLAEDAVGTFDGTYTPNAGTIGYGAPTGIPYCTDPAVTLSDGATIQVPWAPELNPDTAWSVETWIQPSSLGANGGDYRLVLSSEYNEYPFPYNGWYVYQQPNNTFAFVPQPGNGFIVGGPINPASGNQIVAGSWYHLVITDDTINFYMYINGTLVTSYPVADIAFIPDGDGINPDGSAGIGGADGGNFVIGQRTDGAFNTFEGTVDDTAVYNYALSAQQVALHYADATLLTIAKSGTNAVLNWTVGVLQQSTNAAGVYTTIPSATSPYTNALATTKTSFYRVYVP